ncbi:PepSY-associated TM helix domain-containing protein [Neobacillus sp.]|uniref:PepSY-associated TM helix domain-containing protein n=1 Tax=Neobacillus sp. TaxID=2675273 RepID=UPI0028990B15|nr:PepSY-associated TM helix domain-containing protein [Neobacillus sp.]
MKKMRKAHLWIGLIASVLIFIESVTGLLMNEPWLIGQSQIEVGRGNFQPGQFNQGQATQGTTPDSGQANGQTDGQWQGQNGFNGGGQFQGQRGFGGNGNFNGGFRARESQGMLGTIRSLHEGRIGNTNIKWIMDLAAIAMIFLTGSGIYLSIKVLRAERKRKNRQNDDLEGISN